MVILMFVIIVVGILLHIRAVHDLESENESLQKKFDDFYKAANQAAVKLEAQYNRLYQNNDEFRGAMVDRAILQARSVYYIPRLDKIIEYKELVNLGEL